jgi:putative transposase
MRSVYFNTGKYISYNDLYHLVKNDESFRALPTQTSQQILRLLEKNWKSFVKASIEYFKHPNKFTGKPHISNYKEKDSGRNIVVFTNQQCRIKNGFIIFPKKSSIKPLKTKVVGNFQQVRIIPQHTCYIVEVVYKKEIDLNENLKNNLFLGIDLGINNLVTCVVASRVKDHSDHLSNESEISPLLIKGKILKSINQYYNKMRAVYQNFVGDKGTSKRILKLTYKRNMVVQNYLHHTSRFIINYCLQHNIGNIVIGKNDGWKQRVNLSKATNQKFVSIPFATLISQITYKAEEVGIKVILTEESYTSKVDHLANETMEHHETYLGKRIKRGLFRSSSGQLLNADVNGALGILRKVIGNDFLQDFFFEERLLNRGLVVNPLKI